MGFLKGLKNFTKSAMGDSSAMMEQGMWMLKNNQIEAAMNNFSAASLKGEPEALKMWGTMLINYGTGPIDTLAGLLKIKKATNVGLSFSSNIGVKTIIKKSKNKNVNYLILDKYFINNKKIQKIKKNKYFYTIKNKKEFFKYSKKNNLIFENL